MVLFFLLKCFDDSLSSSFNNHVTRHLRKWSHVSFTGSLRASWSSLAGPSSYPLAASLGPACALAPAVTEDITRDSDGVRRDR